jgi:hypothetical protein
MRAHEFITEASKSIVKSGKKLPKRFHHSLPAAHRVGGTADRLYDLTKLLIQVAAEDGSGHTEFPSLGQSWAGKNNIATPYTKAELDMLRHAYRKLGIEWDDVMRNNPDAVSEELPDTQTKSIMLQNPGLK